MSAIKVAVVGVGSLDRAIPLIASLATYFGERPLDIAFYHEDEERLDLVDRFARLCFLMTKATHGLMSTAIQEEALQDVDRIILLHSQYPVAFGIPTLDLRTGWPFAKEDVPEFATALQILRWLNGEEYPYDIFKNQESSPLKAWLDDSTSAARAAE